MDELWQYVVALLIVLALVAGFSAVRASLVSEDKAIRTFEANGYTDIQITHKAWFMVSIRGCGSDDTARFDAVVTNSAGEVVDNVYVCASWLKGGTLRTR